MDLGISLTYYDGILAAITGSLAGGALAGVLTGLQVRSGLVIGALVATIFIYDAMFRNPPRPALSPKAKAAAIVWHVFLGSLLATTAF